VADQFKAFHQRAKGVLPGGVNAAARLERYFDAPFPVIRAEGPFLYGVDGARYIDLCASHGASLLGHGHPAIVAAVQRGLAAGIMCAHETEEQIALAEEIVELVPCAEAVRFCGTGTETALHGIRLARAITGRNIIVKFEGHFHGHSDSLGFAHWPPPNASQREFRTPSSAGVPDSMGEMIRVLPFNDLDVLEMLFEREAGQIAAVILEPVNYNGGTILPRPGFLEGLRKLTRSKGCLLIFDEILSCFRTNTGCMQREFGVVPDICFLGKALGGGLPISAVAGDRSIMAGFSPAGRTQHSGTYIADLLSVSASRAFLNTIKTPSFYPELLSRCDRLVSGMKELFLAFGLPIKVQAFGARFSLLFGIDSQREIASFRDCAIMDEKLAEEFYRKARGHGLYLHPGWHHGITSAHGDGIVDDVLDRFGTVCGKICLK
jgi:glutamate-1-semialdehyde 2,1-aminomutase